MRRPLSIQSKRRTAAIPLAVALGAGTLLASSPAVGDDLPTPWIHYSMDEVTDGVVADSSGNGFDAAVDGEYSPLTDGETQAIELPGGNGGGYVTLPREALEGATSLTVSARVKWSGEGSAWQRIFDIGTNSTRYMFTSPANADGNLRTAATASGGSAEAGFDAYDALPVGEWVTVTTTLDAEADAMTTYIDGAAVSSTAVELSAADLLDAGDAPAGYLGKSFYSADPLLQGAIDDVQIFQEALTPAQVGLLVDEVPSLKSLVDEDIAVRTIVGTAPELPERIRASYSDGYDRDIAVTWAEIDPDQYADLGEFTVLGDAAGVDITATVSVHDGGLEVDLSEDTGEFHGGAAGTLYGVYGEDLPSDNLLEGMGVRTVSTKAQDGPQHPGADALEVVRPLADATDGDVYIYMTDIHRGFPYEWEGGTPEEKMDIYADKIAAQADQVLELPVEYQDNIVFVPFNEPEGNMFGTGTWSYDGTSWLDDPTAYFAAWDRVNAVIKDRLPNARIAGPNTSILYTQTRDFLDHTIEAETVPEVMSWHELSHPEAIRTSVDTYRGWEQDAFEGTPFEGTELPININEYAFNYHTSVPGQMIQWISAIEDSKVDADIAYWNIDGNLSDSAVESNRGNGQWWLFNAYSKMSGHTVAVTPPSPGENYTLQGVSALDEDNAISRTIIGGADGAAPVNFVHVPEDVFGDSVRVTVNEIPWTGQLGDSARPRLVSETIQSVDKGSVSMGFDGDALPMLEESSAYEIIVTPAGSGDPTTVSPTTWTGSFEAEDAAHTGTGYSLNGPEGSPSDVGKFYTSGGYDVGGLRTGSDVVLDFEVTVPEDGMYDLSVFANSMNTSDAVSENGPTNVFVRVDGEAEQEILLPLAYKWVVWDHADTTVELAAGTHMISLATESVDGESVTKGDAIVDRITLALPNPDATTDVYEAEYADLLGGSTDFADSGEASGAGGARLADGDSATFWVYSDVDGEKLLGIDATGDGVVSLNGRDVLELSSAATEAPVSLSGGVNKIVVTGASAGVLVDRLTVGAGDGDLPTSEYEAEDAQLAGEAATVTATNAIGAKAVDNVGGEPGNGNTLTFEVEAEEAGPHAVAIRYANPEQSPASHYNPDPIARRADVSVNAADSVPVWFPHSFHENNFWEKTVVLDLDAGTNTIAFASEEAPNFDGETYASEVWPEFALRSQWAPVIDRISVAPLVGETAGEASPLSVDTEVICRGPRAILDVRITNSGDDRIKAELTTPYATRPVVTIEPGATARRPIPTRSSSLPDGEITIAFDGIEEVHPYTGASCN